MATSSPYTSNDYGVFNHRNYNLPINQIAGAFAAKNNAWEQGAEQVKSRYDSLVDLDLSKPENIKIRNEFLQKAQADLQKLSTKDLSDPNIQKQGLSLFQPLLQDKGILYDDQATKHYKKILGDASQYRKKDNGKYYNDANLQYALDGWDDFLKSPDRNAGEQYLQKAKEFTPYYNPSDEIGKINKDCGATNISNESSTGKYIQGVTDKSKTSSKIYGCLEAGLSDQAKTQLKIEGHVAYGKNYSALAQDFIESSNDKKKVYTTQLGQLQAQKAALSKTKGNEDQMAQIDSQIGQLSDVVSSIDKDTDKYSKWDENYIKDNYDQLAYTAYSKRWKDAYSKAFATTDITHTTKANPVYITEYTQNEMNKRMSAGFAHDFAENTQKFNQDVALKGLDFQQQTALHNLDFQHKLLLGTNEDGSKMDPVERANLWINGGGDPSKLSEYMGTAVETQKDNGDVLAANIAQSASKDKEINNDVFDKLKKAMPNNDLLKSIGTIVDAPDDIKNVWRVAHEYIAHAPVNDPLRQQLTDGENASYENSRSASAIQSVYNDAKDRVAKQNPEIYGNYNTKKAEILKDIKPIQTRDGQTLSPARLLNIYNGIDPVYKIAEDISSTPIVGTAMIASQNSGAIVNKQTGKTEALSPTATKLLNLSKDKTINFNEKLNEELGKHYLTQKLQLNLGNIFTKGSQASNFVSQLVGGQLGEGYVAHSVGNIDGQTGEINVQINTKKGEPIAAKDIISALQSSGAGADNYSYVDDNTIKLKIPGAQNLIRTPQHDLEMRQLVDYATTQIDNHNKEKIIEAGRTKQGIKIELKVAKKIGGGVEYEILGNGKTMPFQRTGIDPKEEALSNLQDVLNPNIRLNAGQ